MVIHSEQVAIRWNWMAWVRGALRGVTSYLFTSLAFLIATAVAGVGHSDGGALVELPWGWLFFLWAVPTAVSRGRSAAFQVPLFSERETVEIAGGEIVVTSRRWPPRFRCSDIRRAWLAGGGREIAVLQTRGRTLYVNARTRANAEALLREAGVGPEQRVQSMALSRSPRATWLDADPTAREKGREAVEAAREMLVFAAPLLAVFGVIHLLTGWVWWLGLAAAVLATTIVKDAVRSARLVASHVTVGTDGLTISSFGQRRFVRIRQVERVLLYKKEIHLSLWSGERLVLAAPTPAATEALFDRIESIVALGEPEAPVGDVSVLTRGERSVGDWLRAVRGAVEKAGSYRGGWLDGQDLVAVVGNPREDAEKRIAAAAALSVRGDPETRSRLRIALDACADEPSRIAIEKALEGEIEAAEIEAALSAAPSRATRS